MVFYKSRIKKGMCACEVAEKLNLSVNDYLKKEHRKRKMSLKESYLTNLCLCNNFSQNK